MPDSPLLLVGLGNPGEQYAKNRHNAGFILIDAIHDHYGFKPWRAKFDGLLSEGAIAGRKTYLLKPMTYMNVSGVSVGPAMRFFKIQPDAVVVVHDEMDLAAGKLKVKTGGGDAGHNGLRSITEHVGAEYRRVRIGVGHPGTSARVTGHVLSNFSKADAEWFGPMLDAMTKAATHLADDDDSGFMNKVALLTQPPKPQKKKPEHKPEPGKTDGI